MRLTLVLRCVNCGSAGNTKELERFYEEAVKSPSGWFNEFLVRAQRLVACCSLATRQRSCPGSLQQIRQCCDHENDIGARSRAAPLFVFASAMVTSMIAVRWMRASPATLDTLPGRLHYATRRRNMSELGAAPGESRSLPGPGG